MKVTFYDKDYKALASFNGDEPIYVVSEDENGNRVSGRVTFGADK